MISKILILLIKAYRFLLSPLLGNCCRFHPTCSEYCIEAIKVHGALKGLLLGFKRIIKCHPYCEGGFDIVPEKKI
jgi:putative membrane protein insertion efficiency factor